MGRWWGLGKSGSWICWARVFLLIFLRVKNKMGLYLVINLEQLGDHWSIQILWDAAPAAVAVANQRLIVGSLYNRIYWSWCPFRALETYPTFNNDNLFICLPTCQLKPLKWADKKHTKKTNGPSMVDSLSTRISMESWLECTHRMMITFPIKITACSYSNSFVLTELTGSATTYVTPRKNHETQSNSWVPPN